MEVECVSCILDLWIVDCGLWIVWLNDWIDGQVKSSEIKKWDFGSRFWGLNLRPCRGLKRLGLYWIRSGWHEGMNTGRMGMSMNMNMDEAGADM